MAGISHTGLLFPQNHPSLPPDYPSIFLLENHLAGLWGNVTISLNISRE